MNPEELIPAQPYWAIRYGQILPLIFQTPLLGRGEGATPGYIFLNDLKPLLFWANELGDVYHTQEEAFYGLAAWHQSKVDEYMKSATDKATAAAAASFVKAEDFIQTDV